MSTRQIDMILYAIECIEHEEDRVFMEDIYTQYHRLMYATALEYHQLLAQDIMQSALLKLITHLDTLRKLEPKALASYIVVTVKHTALNMIRHENIIDKHIASEMAPAFIESMEASDSKPEESVLLLERRKLLLSALEALSEDDRILLYGKYILNQSDVELGQLLDCPTSAIRMRLTRARRAARQEFSKQEEGVHGYTTGKA
ncbi:sigma-70 family RNA polymerase sigma factor [Bengtsoniella intestinalis]|uniref:RNA polymerase sigma factor n=1 Tax=Bengtsoniella intestinalis TaxID=3073143 RepID=UPI00391F296E